MIPSMLESGWRIDRIESCRLMGERWRDIGCNARKGRHGKSMPLDLVRISIAGQTGFGWSAISRTQAEAWIGTEVKDLFTPEGRVKPAYYGIEYPLLDWLGHMLNQPVYALFDIGEGNNVGSPPIVPCYDATIYFDDLHLDDDAEAVEWMQMKALEGWQAGHRAFKIKVGRGARHMPMYRGMKRDIEIIKGFRKALGPDAQIMIDANNSYNLNLTKEVLGATADVNITFIEEPFYEDPILYEDLKQWMDKQGLHVMIADGEGLTVAPSIVSWAKNGLIDILQFDIRFHGFNKLLRLGDELRGTIVKQAPHNYGGPYGNYASCHVATALERFLTIEWDEVRVPGLEAPGYAIVEGKVHVPAAAGFGLHLDDSHFVKSVQEQGWSVQSLK
ncbi:enolase C-terminal domain-like protein [Paenibacillus sedimenti]|uniref:Mandelate racemase n=1 Tax=Paenibacillus sedimenti TaxID=2770274 RepID=A0A926QKK9_9BACL|nr:enolase C-terminal domain-like protein [Paenibacillus sedimenti]MBD0381582.1 mandelate racemase [Paenibacillus sedimenti]